MNVNNEPVSSDIESVSYISDGKKLNATIWFNQPFNDPPTQDSIDEFEEQLEIKTNFLASPNERSLQDLNDTTIANILSPEFKSTILQNNVTTIGNTNAYKIIYNTTAPDGLVLKKNIIYLAIQNNKSYEFTFSILNETFDQLSKKIDKVVNSINFIDPSNNSKIDLSSKKLHNSSDINVSNGQTGRNIQKSFSLHSDRQYELKDLDLKISLPSSWIQKFVKDGESGQKMTIFRSPYEDQLDKFNPSYHDTTLTMALAIDSMQHTGVTDYRIIHQKEKESNRY